MHMQDKDERRIQGDRRYKVNNEIGMQSVLEIRAANRAQLTRTSVVASDIEEYKVPVSYNSNRS